MAFKRVFEPIEVFTGFDKDGDPVYDTHLNYCAKESIGDILAVRAAERKAERKAAQDKLDDEIAAKTYSPPIVNIVEVSLLRSEEELAAEAAARAGENLSWFQAAPYEVNLIKLETQAQKNAFKKYGRSGWVQSQKRVVCG